MIHWLVLLFHVLIVVPLVADNEPVKQDIPAEVDAATIPSLVNLTSMPSAIVNGSVNVITGDLCESDEEDVLYSPEPYVLGHTYFSSSLEEGNLGAGWNFLHHHLIEVFQPRRISYTKSPCNAMPYLLPIEAFIGFVEKSPEFGFPTTREDHNHDIEDRLHDGRNYRDHGRDDGTPSGPDPIFLSLYDPSGGRLLYKTKFDYKHKERSLRKFKLESKLTGYTNVVGGRMSGQTNLKNIKLKWDKKGDCFHVTLGDGTKRLYQRQWKTKEMKKEDRKYSENYRDYQLYKEIKPSGNSIIYEYNDKHEIVEIRAYNRDNSHRLYSLTFDQRTTGDFAKHPNLTVFTSDGFGHTYFFQKLEGSYMHGTYSVSHIRRQGYPFTNFVYSEKSPRHKKRVIKKETEGGYYVSTKYYRPSSNWMNSRTVTPKNKKERKFLRDRVRMQLAPVGPQGQEVITHRYFYYKDDNGGGHCTVRDAHNNISRHFWNKDKRLIRVTKSDANDKRLMSEKYYWGENDTEDEGRLLCRVLEDEKAKPILANTFKYDSRGNVIENVLYARITENSGSLRMDDGQPHHESCDKQLTRYTYTNDGFNLLESSCDPLGNYTYYEYIEGTNLMQAKFLCEGRQIKKREFFDYDASGIVIQHIVDDGSTRDKHNLTDATERHITRTKPRYQRPRFGESEEVMEFFYNFTEQKESFLKKTVNHFNEKGFVVKREHVDQLGGREYYEYTYDEVGRITSTKNPLGQTEYIEYDITGRIIKKSGPRKDVRWNYVYDVAGRLIEETETHKNGPTLTKRYEYDNLSRKTAITDHHHNTTRFEYDALNRVTAIIYPSIYDHEGKRITPKKTYSYKHLGTHVTEIDENGLVTQTSYNAIGKVCDKKLPEKTKIQCYYDLKGNLIKEVAPNGATTHREYDAFNRIIQTRVMMQEEVLCKSQVTYNNFHPILEIGPTGEKTAYSYDWAGRKAKVERHGQRQTTYVYDAKGRIMRERTFLEDEAFIGKRYKYDALNRITYESYRDHKERVRTYKEYGYDVEGNKRYIKQEIGGKNIVSRTTYHPHGIVKSQKDARGNRTFYTYDYNHKNQHGQTVLKKQTIDPKGTTLEEIYDTRGNLSHSTTLDSSGRLLANKELFYDASNNLVRVHEYAIQDGKKLKMIITRFCYKDGHLTEIHEAAGTPEEKITRYEYNSFGQKKSATFSDGTILRYRYDGIGRVKRFFAADKSVDYRYEYDASDRIVSVSNGVTGQKTVREYNRFGELKQEILENDLALQYSYDKAGRPAALTLPDNSKVLYTHSALLEKITRVASSGKELYSHSILERDKSGLIKACQLADSSQITYSHNKLGQCKKITHEHFEEHAKQFDVLGNLTLLQTKDTQGSYSKAFSYDFLSQLISEEGPTNHTYSYDSLNNRLSHNNNAYSVNSLHAVLSDGARTFTYDLRGNRTSMQEQNGQTRYFYDALDRLVAVEPPGTTRYVYGYDGFNRRILKEAFSQSAFGWEKTATTKYIYTLDNEIGSTDANNTICELRILGEGRGAEIGAAIALELGGTIYTPIHDQQGNVVTLLDHATGGVVEHYRYDAFGNETAIQDASINPWRFSSKRVDPETGMSNFGRRYYDPTIGKWLTQDPLGLKAGPNLYAYCINNPMTHFDLYGLLDEDGKEAPSLSDRLRDMLSDGFDSVKGWVCKGLEVFIHHSPHIGSYNDKAVDALRSARGAPPLERPAAGIYKIYDGSPTATGCTAVALPNGINCTFEDAKKNLEKLKLAFLGNHPDMYILYTPTKGTIMDLIQAAYNMFGGQTANISAISAGMQFLSDQALATGPDAYWTMNPHSNGGQTSYLASQGLDEKQKARIHVESIASTKIFDRSQGFRGANNHLGWSDFVSTVTDPFGVAYRGIMRQGSLQMVGHPIHFPCSQHAYSSKEYSLVVNKIAQRHM